MNNDLLSFDQFKKLYESAETDDKALGLEDSLKEYGKISKELEDLYASIKEKTAKLEKDKTALFSKILDEMTTSKKNLVVVDKIVAEIKKTKVKGRTNPKYKEAFVLALTKVNDSTKKVLNEALTANTTITEASEKTELSIKISESKVSDIWNKLKTFVSKFYEKFKKLVENQTNAVKDLEKSFNKIVSLNESNTNLRYLREISGFVYEYTPEEAQSKLDADKKYSKGERWTEVSKEDYNEYCELEKEAFSKNTWQEYADFLRSKGLSGTIDGIEIWQHQNDKIKAGKYSSPSIFIGK